MSHIAQIASLPPAHLVVSVVDHGAQGNGVTDDSVAVRAAIDEASAAGGGTVYFPNGTYIVSEHLNNVGSPTFYSINIPSNVALLGQSRAAVIKLLAGATTNHNVRLLNIAAASVNTAVSNLTVDGNYPANTDVGLHNDGIFIEADASRCRISGCEVRNCCGAAFNPNLRVSHILIEDCYAHDTQWSGVSIGDASGQHDITIRDSDFENVVGAIHIEITTGTDKILIDNCYLSTVQTGNFAVNIAGGPTTGTFVTNVTLRDCQIRGFVNISNASNVLVEGCEIVSSDVAPVNPHAAVRVMNEGSNITVRGNFITITSTSNGPAGVEVGSNVGNVLTNIHIIDNDVFVQGPGMDGIYIQNPIDARVEDNRVFYTGVTQSTGYGLHVYQHDNQVLKRMRMDGNRVVDFNTGVRVDAAVDGASYRITNLLLRRNVFESSSFTMSKGLDLNPTADALWISSGGTQGFPGGNNAVIALDMIDNLTVGATTPINTLPAIPVLIGGNRDGVADWRGTGAPTFSATKGSTYRRTDGGAGTCLYVNESGSTTWTGK
jgi:hypothetical protein